MIADAAIVAISAATGKIADAVRVRDELRIAMLAKGGDFEDLVYNDLVREDETKEAFHDVGAPFRWLADQLDGGDKKP